LTFPVAGAGAAELSHTLGYRGEYSNNVSRLAVDPRHEWTHILLAGLDYRDRGPDLDLRIAPVVEFLHYQKNTFEDELRGTLDVIAVWSISPQRFLWTVEDNAAQTRRVATDPDTPDNRVNTNVFGTGPDWFLRMSPVNTLQLGARYVDIYVEDSDAGSQRASAYARWLYQATVATALSLNVEATKVEYDNELVNPNYRRDDAFVRIQSTPTRSSFTLDLGATRIDRERAPEVDGALARLLWTRRLMSDSTAGVGLESQYGDTGSDLIASAQAANVGTGTDADTVTLSQNLVTQDVFYARRGEAFYNRQGEYFGLEIRGVARELEFELLTPDDRKEYGGVLELSYRYSPLSTFTLYGNRLETEYRNIAREDTDGVAGLRYDYLLTRTLTFTAEALRSKRDSTLASESFVEDRIALSLVYSSGPAFRRR
jgi:hypothetical protein